MWQELIVLVFVLWAAYTLLRHFRRPKPSAGGQCRGCQGCGSDKACGQ